MEGFLLCLEFVLSRPRWSLRFHFQSGRLFSQWPNKYLRAAMNSLNQVMSRFFPNIVVTPTTAIFQLLPIKDKTLLLWRDSVFVLHFCFHHLNSVHRLHF